jgi:hypothetical protein
MHPIEHFRTVARHRKLVREYCFRLGLYTQGITHDLSKYSPAEFWRSARYYRKGRNPIRTERSERGESLIWLHHKGRNKHHYEYWVDYHFDEEGNATFSAGKMPKRYIAEMFCDNIASSKIYKGDQYTDASPYEHYIHKSGKPIHPETAEAIEKMLIILKDQGEDAAFEYVKEWLKSE